MIRLLLVSIALGLASACMPAHGQRHAWLALAPALAPELHHVVGEPPASPDVEVLYVTDRVPLLPDNPTLAYGFGRDEQLRVGTATVTLGQGATAEELHARTTDPQRTERWKVRATAVSPLGSLGDPAFDAEVARRIEASGSGDVYLTVHGIATGFADSLFPLAQIWHHLGRRGLPIAYSWPTGINGWVVNAYGYERESGDFTLPHFARLLRHLAAMPAVERVHLIGHSRGNAVILDTLRDLTLRLAIEGLDAREVLKIQTLVLAAPDVSIDVFQARFLEPGFTRVARRTVLYVSEQDSALSASSWMHGARRIGSSNSWDLGRVAHGGPTEERIEVVDCGAKRVGRSHDYYLTDPTTLAHVLGVLATGSTPP